MKIRQELAKVVKVAAVCEFGQAGIYLVGDKDAAIHSEPKKDIPRIFISVLTGSQSQIEEWAKILEDHEMVTIRKSSFGKMEISKI